MRKRRSKVKRARNDTTYKARGLEKKKRERKTKAPKTRNMQTMSESEFWSFIRSALRNRTRFWKPRLEALKRARRVYNGPNKRQKWEFKCAICGNHFKQTQVEVNHIIPAGSLKSKEDLPSFVENLFCEVDNLEVVCKTCHKEHHKKQENVLQ